MHINIYIMLTNKVLNVDGRYGFCECLMHINSFNLHNIPILLIRKWRVICPGSQFIGSRTLITRLHYLLKLSKGSLNLFPFLAISPNNKREMENKPNILSNIRNCKKMKLQSLKQTTKELLACYCGNGNVLYLCFPIQ